MSKVRKKKPPGPPGEKVLTITEPTPPSLSVLSEIGDLKNEKEMIENDNETVETENRDYEEKLRFEVVLTKATTATCVRTQAVSALSKLFEGDKTIILLPYFTHSRENFKAINNIDDIPHQEAALRAYVSDPTLKTVPNQHTKVRLQFFVRLLSNNPIEVTVKKNEISNWYKAQDIYITLMELDTTDNERIGILIGKAPRITSLQDLHSTVHLLYSNRNNNDQNVLPPFQLSIDNIGNLKDQTRTRVVSFTCSKHHSRLLTTILQTIFPATTNHQFVSFAVFYSLPKETQVNILSHHKERTYGKTMFDITLPSSFTDLSSLVTINDIKTNLRASIGNIQHADGKVIHFDIDDATRNNATIMIASPKDVPRLQTFIGEWIHLHHKQTIDWNTAPSYSSVTHRLDAVSRNSVEAFTSAFPTIITVQNKLPQSTKQLRPNHNTGHHPSPPKPPPKNAWKSLSYATSLGDKPTSLQAKRASTTPSGNTAATVNTVNSSNASHLTSFDNIDTQLYNLQSRNTRLSLKVSLLESRTTLLSTGVINIEQETLAILDDIAARISRLELASDRQNRINQNLLTTLSITDDTDRHEEMRELAQRIKNKHRIRQKERISRAQEVEEVKEKMIPLPKVSQLEARAKRHVRKLKDLLDRHAQRTRDDSDATSVSSCSSLGLSEFEFDENDLSAHTEDDPMDSYSENSIQSTHQVPQNQETVSSNYDTQSDIIMDLVSIMDNPDTTNPLPSPLSQLSSLQQAASSTLTHPMQNPTSLPSTSIHSDWEEKPTALFQEWTETSKKPKTENKTVKNLSGHPGRLSPPTMRSAKISSNHNRYAILEDIPTSRPPIESSGLLIQSAPSAASSITSDFCNEATLETLHHSSPGHPNTNPANIVSTSPPATLSGDTSVQDFFAKKHAKKGSPRRNKRIRLPSSPPRSDKPATDITHHDRSSSSTNDLLSRSNDETNKMDYTDEPDSSASDIRKYFLEAVSPTSDTRHHPTRSLEVDLLETSHTQQGLLPQENANIHHDSQGQEYNTATLYTSHQDETSDTPTVLASADEDMCSNASDSLQLSDHSLHSSPQSPSDSIQYTSSNADLEGNTS